MSFPSNVCFKNQVNGQLKVKNTSDCAAQFRATFNSQQLGKSTSNAVKLSPGEQHTFNHSIPSMPNSPINLEQAVEVQKANGWSQADSRSSKISPLFSNFQFVSVPIPSYQQPGTPVSPNITIENTGQCAGQVQVGGSHINSNTFSLKPGETTSYKQNISMPASPVNINMNLRNIKQNSQADAFSGVVNPMQTSIVNPNNGSITLVGGFSSPVRYAGFIQGRNVKGKNLDSKDKVHAGLINAEFSGTVSTNPADKDIIEFSSLKYLSARFANNTMWVLNENLKGTAQTFEYSTYPVSIARKIFPSVTDNPDISITASPTDRLAVLRNKLGVNALIKNPPLQITRSNV